MILSLSSFFSVFLGGGIGATSRWLIALVAKSMNMNPWIGTFFANFIGCICIFAFIKLYGKDVSNMSLFVKVGILGGLTTFSGFALEVVSSLQSGRTIEAVMILGLNILLGIVVGFAILR